MAFLNGQFEPGNDLIAPRPEHHIPGLTPGDRVGIQWPNAIEVVQVFVAAFKAGLIAVPVNLRLKPQEITS